MNIEKITHVHLYVGFGSEISVINSFACKKFLDQEGIKYVILNYPHDELYGELFDNLSSWVFDTDYKSHQFKEFPLIMWQEAYDNFDVIQCVAQNLEELKASRLVLNKALIQ